MDRYVVIGNPVGHSKSPLIHSHFARQTDQAIRYDTVLAEQTRFRETALGFFADGGKGANVTVPFKQEAFELADVLSPEAMTAGAVNTLYLNDEQQLIGHNTDGIGLVTDILNNHGGTLAGKKILVLGAGGATRGILQPLLNQNPDQIRIANRTTSKAVALAEAIQKAQSSATERINISGCGFEDLTAEPCDWIINATSASLQGEVPVLPAGVVSSTTWCYDLMYSSEHNKEQTLFCQWANESGAGNVMDGLGMLVEQAAESFFVWRGVRPQTKEIIDLLRNE